MDRPKGTLGDKLERLPGGTANLGKICRTADELSEKAGGCARPQARLASFPRPLKEHYCDTEKHAGRGRCRPRSRALQITLIGDRREDHSGQAIWNGAGQAIQLRRVWATRVAAEGRRIGRRHGRRGTGPGPRDWTEGRGCSFECDGRTHGRTHGRTDGRTDARTHGRTHGRTDSAAHLSVTDGRTDARTHGRTHGRTDRCAKSRRVSPMPNGSPKAAKSLAEARQGSPEARQARLAKGSPRLANS
eukprot:gene14110-biopygen8703